MIRRFTHSDNGFKPNAMGTLDYIEHDLSLGYCNFVYADGRTEPCTSFPLALCLEQVKKGVWSEIIYNVDDINNLVSFPTITKSCKS